MFVDLSGCNSLGVPLLICFSNIAVLSSMESFAQDSPRHGIFFYDCIIDVCCSLFGEKLELDTPIPSYIDITDYTDDFDREDCSW